MNETSSAHFFGGPRHGTYASIPGLVENQRMILPKAGTYDNGDTAVLEGYYTALDITASEGYYPDFGADDVKFIMYWSYYTPVVKSLETDVTLGNEVPLSKADVYAMLEARLHKEILQDGVGDLVHTTWRQSEEDDLSHDQTKWILTATTYRFILRNAS